MVHVVFRIICSGSRRLPVGGREITREAAMIEQAEEELLRIKKDEPGEFEESD